jgi:hypothetical protein
VLPSAGGQGRIAMLQIDLRDLQIYRGLVCRLVFGVQQAQGVGFVLVRRVACLPVVVSSQ